MMELDLHTLTRREAEIELYDFLARVHDLGLSRVRIITGKGINSPGRESVLKPFVENILKAEKLKFKRAKMNEGGEGALEVQMF